MKIHNLRQANDALQAYVPLVAQLTGTNTTLDRILPLMEVLGNPQERLRVIHIAGTSGKTSTACYMAGLLHATGRKVGLTVSPHVDQVTERVQINGIPISDEMFCTELEAFLEIVETMLQPPSYFELLYAFSIWVFDRQEVAYAVIETGLGGLHDATNVVRNRDKFCIITDIGYDHMHILGNTLEEIALQKIGIVHSGNSVLTYQQSPSIMRVFQDWVDTHEAQLIVASPPVLKTSMMPQFQQRNWQLAHQAFSIIRDRDHLPSLTNQALADTRLIQVPGRMEIVDVGGKTVVMDGAHNAQKMEAFLDSFRVRFPGVRPTVLLSFRAGKEYTDVVPIIASISDNVIITAFGGMQDMPVTSMDVSELAVAFSGTHVQSVRTIIHHADAMAALLSEPTVCVVTGSFYLLSQLRSEGLLPS
jgi:dihydrofolate synthase/folylpolyglutamate synthase